MFIKVCGLKTSDDVAVAAEAGADAVGFVVSASSPRGLSVDRVAELAAGAPPGVSTVLVVNELPVAEAIAAAQGSGVDLLQLHGPRYGADDFAAAARAGVRTWRATSVAHQPDLRVGAWGEEALLLDSARPGSGEAWEAASLPARPEGHWLLAGGLDPWSVAGAIEALQPWGVDVSSGVESTRGVKHHALVRAFVAAARAAG